MAGQVCGQLKEIRPVADILKSLYEDAKTVLKKAGVVDSGGRGLIIVFTGFYKCLTNDNSLQINFGDYDNKKGDY